MEEASEQFRRLSRTYASVGEYAELLRTERPLIARESVDTIARCALRVRDDGTFVLKCHPALAREDNNKNTPDEVQLAWMRAIACPTLIVRGSGSAVFPPTSVQRMTKVMKNVQVRFVPMAGHAVMLDNPQGFVDAVLPFVMAP